MRPITAYILCAALAPAMSMGSILFLLHSGFDAYWPAFSDDVTLNHQIRTFAAAGFSGGYYTIGELPPPAAFTHFGAHGPFYPALYGLLLWPFGASVSGPIWAHHGVMYAATLFGLMLARPSAANALFIAAVIATFWPAIAMLTASMQEGLHFSIAILGAAAAFHKRASIGIVLYAAASLVRPTWALGLVMLLRKPRNVTKFAVGLGGVALFSVGSLMLFMFVAAPAPRGIIERAQDAIGSNAVSSQTAELAMYYSQRVVANLTFVISPSRWQPLEGQVLVLTGVLPLLALRRDADWRLRMSAVALAGMLTLVIILYDADSYRGFRTLGPFTLLALITTVLCMGSRKVAVLLVGINLLFFGSFIHFIQQNRQPVFASDYSALAKIADELSDRMRFDAAANPWCNTILVDHMDLGAIAATIPAGFGLSVVAEPERVPDNPKSAFVMISPESIDGIKFSYEVVYRSDNFSILRNSARAC